MARNIGVSLNDPQPVYRAVILTLYSGLTNRELKRYTTGDGTEFLYHESTAYGPYETKAPATAQITQALRHHEGWKKNGHYEWRNVWNRATGVSERVPTGDSVPELTAFVEEQLPSWNQMPATVRTA
jgi:hypothetical protein